MTAPALLRLAAATAALVLAVSSRGDALVLAAALALAAWRPASGAAIAAALVASSWRWGSSSLEDIAGAQAVLGPAGWVGPPWAAAGAWLGAAALLGATPGLAGRATRAVAAAASGAAAAVVVAGPAPGGALWARVTAAALATVVAYAVASRRANAPHAQAPVDAVALIVGAAALVATSQEAGDWAGIVSSEGLREGVSIAVAAAAVVTAGLLARSATEQHRA